MTKNAKRREFFKALGAAITKIGDPDVSDYLTGRPSHFKIKNGEPFKWNDIPGRPVFKTPQWQRGIK